jgi:hypothetical protein
MGRVCVGAVYSLGKSGGEREMVGGDDSRLSAKEMHEYHYFNRSRGIHNAK